MKKTKSGLTLTSIKRIIFENNIDLAKMMDEKLARNNVAIFGDIDKLGERLETRIGSLENKFDNLKKEMNQRFDQVDDQFQNVLQAASDITDHKLKEFRRKYLAA